MVAGQADLVRGCISTLGESVLCNKSSIHEIQSATIRHARCRTDGEEERSKKGTHTFAALPSGDAFRSDASCIPMPLSKEMRKSSLPVGPRARSCTD